MNSSVTNARSLALLVGSAVLFVALCTAAEFALKLGLAWRCPVMALLHVPCPSCGSTRALAALCELDLLRALRFQPLLIGALFGAPMAFLYSDKWLISPRVGWTALAAAILANWLYLLLFLPR